MNHNVWWPTVANRTIKAKILLEIRRVELEKDEPILTLFKNKV